MPITISSAQTDIEIINMAARLAGQNSINSIIPGDKFAESAAALYGQLVSAELGSNRWRFARHYQEIASLTTLDPGFEGWQFFWTLPADLLMLTSVDPMIKYTVYGDRLLTKTNRPLTALYTRSVSVNKWPEPFKMYIAYALANQLSVSVTTSDRLARKIEEDMKLWQSRALFADGQNSPGKQIRSNPYLQVRR